MTQKYGNIMVAVDGSHESELALKRALTWLSETALVSPSPTSLIPELCKVSQPLMQMSARTLQEDAKADSRAERKAQNPVSVC